MSQVRLDTRPMLNFDDLFKGRSTGRPSSPEASLPLWSDPRFTVGFMTASIISRPARFHKGLVASLGFW